MVQLLRAYLIDLHVHRVYVGFKTDNEQTAVASISSPTYLGCSHSGYPWCNVTNVKIARVWKKALQLQRGINPRHADRKRQIERERETGELVSIPRKNMNIRQRINVVYKNKRRVYRDDVSGTGVALHRHNCINPRTYVVLKRAIVKLILELFPGIR